MAVTSDVIILNVFQGDIVASQENNAAQNTNSPGKIDVITLALGANTITPPSGGSSPKGVTIIPPIDNTETITLKGITGDTGVLLHPTDPTYIGLGSTTNTFVLTASGIITGLRLIWS